MDILKKYKISANKRLGQNFLINEDTIEGIIEAAEVEKEDLIIEIGPGLRKLNQKIAR
jgi:16S rRNA (adenine1518-N6/adenine1519-N6)-dimethyltransferase